MRPKRWGWGCVGMRIKSTIMKIILFIAIVLLVAIGCKNQEENVEVFERQGTYGSTTKQTADEKVSAATSSYHADPDYKYEYRTGTSGNYRYNYDVNGSDPDGNDVSGNISVSGKYGEGIIEDANGDERDVDVEWVRYGVLEAIDEDGNTYELEVD